MMKATLVLALATLGMTYLDAFTQPQETAESLERQEPGGNCSYGVRLSIGYVCSTTCKLISSE